MLFVPGEKRPYIAAQSYKMKVSADADKSKIGPNKHDVTSRELVWWKIHVGDFFDPIGDFLNVINKPWTSQTCHQHI